MSVPDPLGAEVRALFSELTHAGDPAGSTDASEPGAHLLYGEAGRMQHGTHVRFSLRIFNGRITEMRYRVYGCPHTLATCEWLARRLQGGELAALSGAAPTLALGTAADWARSLAVPAAKLGRLLVIEDALQAVLRGADPAMTKGA